jgi:hypothetical protein
MIQSESATVSANLPATVQVVIVGGGIGGDRRVARLFGPSAAIPKKARYRL